MNLTDLMPVRQYISSGLFHLLPFLNSDTLVQPAFAITDLKLGNSVVP